MRQCIIENPEALKEFFGKQVEEEDIILKHSLNVSALSMKLAQKMNLSEEELDEIAVAGLLHDIGLMQLDKEVRDLFMKDRKDLTPAEKLSYSAHVKGNLSALSERPYVNQKIMGLITNHEERKSGEGPHKKVKLSQAEFILSLVNIYDKMCITTEMTPKEVIKEVLISELGNFELDLLNNFTNVLTEEGLLEI